MNINNEIIKYAAYKLQNYRLKQADLGYAAGPWYEFLQHVGRHVPEPVLDAGNSIGSFLYENRKPLLYGAAALGGLALWRRRARRKQIKEKEKIQEITGKAIPDSVLSSNQSSSINQPITVDQQTALDDLTVPQPKTAEYRLSTVMNYMYK